MQEGVTGFICDSVEEAVRAVERIPSLSRKECRQIFEKRFTVGQMAQAYLAIYHRLLGRAVRFAA
jgi:glycosyltransferase involved in cell wall biosynthesis